MRGFHRNAAILIACFCAACSIKTTDQSPDETASRTPRRELASLTGLSLYSPPPTGNLTQLSDDLRAARAAFRADPRNPEKIIWVGRRLGYLWRMNEAIETYSAGIAEHPDYAPLYRHRGHRYISARRFADAARDLERAAELIAGMPEEIEQDGMPNDRNIPLTTTGFNVWYHLGLARFLSGDYEGALEAYRETMKHTRGLDDNIVATVHWMYMTLRRLGRHEEATQLLGAINSDMEIIENDGYHKCLLLYKGLLTPDEVLGGLDAPSVATATVGFGVGNWHLCNGDTARAAHVFEQITAGTSWPAFGYIAAEADLARGLAGHR